VGDVVEVAAHVDRLGNPAWLGLAAEQEELDLGVRVEGEAEVGGPGQRALEDVTRVCVGGGSVRHQDVAEHPGAAGLLRAPGQHLEGRRVGAGQHVGLVDASEALDRRAVEADALGKRPLELGRRDRDRLEEAEDVGEPQPYEADVAFLEGAEHELLLLVHAWILPLGCFADVTWAVRGAPPPACSHR
jgi:hypothetical protein